MITIPKVADNRDQIIADIEGKIGQTIPSLPKAFFRVIATAYAGAIALLYRFGVWVYDQILPQTADAEALERIGSQYGVYRGAPVSAKLTATATGTNSSAIAAGTLWQKNGIVYEQEVLAEITAGVVTITVEALTPGSDSNIENGEKISLVSPIAGIDSDATIASTIIHGEDEETIESYRSEIMDRLANRPQGGAAPDYISWALEVPGIAKAFAFRTAPGTVTVYPLIATTGTRLPDAPKIAEVLAYVQDTHRRPLCADVAVAALTERVVNITVTSVTPSSLDSWEAIAAAWTAHLFKRYPAQYDDEANKTDFISKSAMYGEAAGAGATIIEFEMYLDASPTPFDYHDLTTSEICKLGVVTWP